MYRLARSWIAQKYHFTRKVQHRQVCQLYRSSIHSHSQSIILDSSSNRNEVVETSHIPSYIRAMLNHNPPPGLTRFTLNASVLYAILSASHHYPISIANVPSQHKNAVVYPAKIVEDIALFPYPSTQQRRYVESNASLLPIIRRSVILKRRPHVSS